MSKRYINLFSKGTLIDRAFTVLQREGFLPLFKRGIRYFIGKTTYYMQLGLGGGRKKNTPSIRISPPKADKFDILCFPVINWEFRFQRPQQLLTQFAKKGHRIFYLRANFSGSTDPSLNIREILEYIYELFLPGDPTIAIYRDELTASTLHQSSKALFDFFDENEIFNVIMMIYHPFWLPLALLLKNKYRWKIVYDCIDDITGFDASHKNISIIERELAIVSDLVVVTSRVLYERMSLLNENCTLIPNAADYDYFCNLPARVESPLYGMQTPIIGYFGAIAEWFDVEAVYQAAVKRRDWSFVLIGDTWGGDIKKIYKLPNVYFLGEKPYMELAAYLSGFDVAIMPFLRIPLTEATNPVKIFEYLSAGKPVVATCLPDLQELKDLIFLYSTPDEFIANLEIALRTDTEKLAVKRRAFASKNTWEKRGLLFERLFNMLM